MPISAAVAGASAVAGIYGAHRQGVSSDKAAATTAAANKEATQIARDAEANRRAEFNQQQAEAKRQWDTTEANKQPFRQASQDALMRVRDLLGIPQGAMTSGSAASGGAPPAQMAGSAADLKALIDSGLDPQKAAKTFNQKFGRSTGNEAVYYDPSQHGGIATIGLPDAYLSQESNGWAITPRGGAARAPVSAARLPMPASAGSMAPATMANYAPVIPMSQLLRGVR